MTTEEIRELIKLVAKTGVGRVEIERDDFFIAIDGNTQNNNEIMKWQHRIINQYIHNQLLIKQLPRPHHQLHKHPLQLMMKPQVI